MMNHNNGHKINTIIVSLNYDLAMLQFTLSMGTKFMVETVKAMKLFY